MALLRIVRGPASGTLLPLADEQGVIGRCPSCQAVVPDPTVSRRHARIRRYPDGFFLEPLVGYNATYLNDQRMNGSRPLRNGTASASAAP
jgi:pSer/pThr/pTyr-binding forkhead associated (FHA) protein